MISQGVTCIMQLLTSVEENLPDVQIIICLDYKCGIVSSLDILQERVNLHTVNALLAAGQIP